MGSPPFQLQRRRLHEYSVFGVEELTTQASGNEASLTFHVLRVPDWVCVVPVTREGKVLLVQQFRAGVLSTTLEPPGGIIEPEQTPAQAAARELLEETGYEGELEYLGSVHPNPALCTNRAHLFLARSAVQVAAPTWDGKGERTESVLLAPAQVEHALRSGQITNVIGLAALSAALSLPLSLRTDSPVPASPPHSLDQVLRLVEQMEALQSRKVVELARRLRPDLTPEDIRNPHDFPELEDTDWHYADGHLSGLQAVLLAVRALRNDQAQPQGANR